MTTPSKAPSSPQKPATASVKRGRKPVADKDAPHGRDAQGKPKAPYGYLDDGKPRVHPKRDASKIDLSVIADVREVTEEIAAQARPARARSEQQKAMDTVVKSYHSKWVEAGKPSDWKEIPKGRYHISPEVVTDFKFLIKKAADFHKVRARFGKDLQDKNGNTVIVFGVVDRASKPRKAKTS